MKKSFLLRHERKKSLSLARLLAPNFMGWEEGGVCSINGEQSQYGQDKNVNGVIRQGGGNAKFDIAFFNGERSRFIPECILRSAQWSIHEEVATADAVKMAIEYTDVITEKKAEEEKLENERFSKEKERFSKEKERFSKEKEREKNLPEYKLLQTDDLGAKGVAINIRKELKAAHPKVKFSVRKRDYDCVYIGWTDGPTEEQVREITDKYKYGRFDAMQDMYEDNSSPFNEVFGGDKYVFTQRERSDALIKKALDIALEKYGSELITKECTLEAYNNGVLNNYRRDFFYHGLSHEIHIIAQSLVL
ncbi:LPD29 domain-containing protein [Serratia sp. OS31]|uniref:LPD29 domain-containing protein n=1 Tax=Serratia sp. OS31 TaxID=2760844 RepID=UPI0021051A6C|nr:LPD29 domain-containing protein [Serratia sp. OS31]